MVGKAARILRLLYTPPFDWDHILGFLAGRAIANVEWCDGASYARTVRIGRRTGVIRVHHEPGRRAVVVEIPANLEPAREEIATRVRGLFDLDHDPRALRRALASDPLLGPILHARPGIRVPGGWDGFEIAVRAVVGQQVSVAAARGVLGRLAARLGERVGDAILFPEARRLAAAELQGGMPSSRIATLKALAEAAGSGRLILKRGAPADEAAAALRSIRGIGAWTAGYIAMRALGDADAFPSGDLVLRRTAGGLTARDLELRAESWRPWRAYASILLWSR